MTVLGYDVVAGGRILMPLQGPPDKRPRKIRVPIRNGKVNPDGAIIAHGSTIGASREAAEAFYRNSGYEPEFFEIP